MVSLDEAAAKCYPFNNNRQEAHMERDYAKLKVTPKAERAIRQGHPWVYGEEITSAEGS